MAGFKDFWHRTLVYFGLAEEEEYVEDDRDAGGTSEFDEPEEELAGRYKDRPNVRRLGKRKRRDEIDDIFSDEPGERSRTRVLRPTGNGGAGQSSRVHLLIPKSFNDAQQIGDKIKESVPVIINLQTADSDLSKRLIDFASGLTYGLGGGMQRIAERVFLLTPRNVKVSAEERARLVEKGFFNQS